MEYTCDGTLLGKGSYSTVFLGKHENNVYAVKFYSGKTMETYKSILNEIKILKFLNTLHSPLFVKLLDGWIDEKGSVSIVLEKQQTNLTSVLRKHGPMKHSSTKLKFYSFSIFKCLETLHGRGIVHRDVKLSNFLVSKNSTIVLCDFNMSCAINVKSPNSKEELVSLWYRSPEVILKCHQKHYAIDIWSAACCFLELYFGECLWRGNTATEQFTQIVSTLWPPTLTDYLEWCIDSTKELVETTLRDMPQRDLPSDPLFLSLLKKMLCYSPHSRASATEAMNHEFFDSIRYPRQILYFPKYREI